MALTTATGPKVNTRGHSRPMGRRVSRARGRPTVTAADHAHGRHTPPFPPHRRSRRPATARRPSIPARRRSVTCTPLPARRPVSYRRCLHIVARVFRRRCRRRRRRPDGFSVAICRSACEHAASTYPRRVLWSRRVRRAQQCRETNDPRTDAAPAP